jgi:uncharacterized Zn finger protein (UPF0148 family)
MNDEIRVPVSLPLDSDGFIRRECPNCEREFKWFSDEEGDTNAEVVAQYFCPLCDQYVQDSLEKMFEGIKGMTVKPNRSFSFGIETPDALAEPDDMMIAEPPCHPNEPVKIPDGTAKVYCPVCGTAFTV